jgi:hypothetical protein
VGRDIQRGKVYDAEEAAFGPLPAPEFEDLEGCRAYVREVLESGAWLSLGVELEREPRVEGSAKALGAFLKLYPPAICLPERLRLRRGIVHELAHLATAHLHERTFDEERGYFHFRTLTSEVAGHGPEYAGILLHLVRGLFGEDAYRALSRSYEAHRVKVLPFVPSCRACGAELTEDLLQRNTRRYCSDSCRYVHHTRKRRSAKAPRHRHACQQCGRDFLAARVDAKTCSPKCRQKAYRQRVSNG